MPNLGRPGYVNRVEDLLPGSSALLKEIYSSGQDKRVSLRHPHFSKTFIIIIKTLFLPYRW
jgi:hypothetical protein